MIGFADAGYLSDPHKAMSQTGYVFACGGNVVPWHSQKQTLVATSSNHATVIALYEVSRECIWLRTITQYIQETCRLSISKDPTVLFEDNAACVLK